MENLPKNNIFKESLLSAGNENILQSIKIQTPKINNKINECYKTNAKNNHIEEIHLKYNKLKKKINLFWNKVP